MKNKHDVKLGRTEASMIREMCGSKLKEKKRRNRELLWQDKLKCKDDADWVEHCMMMEVGWTLQRSLRKSQWDGVKDDKKSLGLSQLPRGCTV